MHPSWRVFVEESDLLAKVIVSNALCCFAIGWMFTYMLQTILHFLHKKYIKKIFILLTLNKRRMIKVTVFYNDDDH